MPTEIRYDGQDYTWGFQIPEHDQRHQWFKLDLDPTQTSLTRGLANAHIDPIAAPPSYHKTAEELCTDYLTALRKHAELVIRNKLPASAFISTPIEYVVCFANLPILLLEEEALIVELDHRSCCLVGRCPIEDPQMC